MYTPCRIRPAVCRIKLLRRTPQTSHQTTRIKQHAPNNTHIPATPSQLHNVQAGPRVRHPEGIGQGWCQDLQDQVPAVPRGRRGQGPQAGPEPQWALRPPVRPGRWLLLHRRQQELRCAHLHLPSCLDRCRAVPQRSVGVSEPAGRRGQTGIRLQCRLSW